MKTAYVAGRISRQDEVKEVLDFLKTLGFVITRDWTWTTEIKNESDAQEYRKAAYTSRSQKYAKEAEDDIRASVTSDVFVILSDELGSAMYVEFGAAIAAQSLTGKPSHIYASGPHLDRMLHYQYPSVKWVNSVEEIAYDLSEQIQP